MRILVQKDHKCRSVLLTKVTHRIPVRLRLVLNNSSRSCRKATMLAHNGAIWMVLSIAASLALLSSSSCSPIDPGAAQLPAPTNVGSAVQYAVLTARHNSSECLPVDGAVLRGLLVHVAFDGTLGFPGEGPPKRYVCPLSSADLTDKGPSRGWMRPIYRPKGL